jgi:hypothetical protein
VAEADCLRRIDAHMERGNVLIERIDAHMERGNELMDQNRRAFEDLRTFLRDMTVRQERVLGRMADHLADMTQEQRAQRSALFRMLERLDDGGSAAGA